VKRNIVRIEETKCNGCGLCVKACHEGAIQIIDGKARLVSDIYCDGLGACLGKCPEDAITIDQREAAAFDEHAVNKRMAQMATARTNSAHASAHHSCPGAAAMMLHPGAAGASGSSEAAHTPTRSELRNWPVQLRLAPVQAPYFSGANLLIAADCVPTAFPAFHSRLLAGKTLLIACPKLDDVSEYREKLAEIFHQNNIASVEVAHMEVPCCFGLVQLVSLALRDSGKDIPMEETTVGITGGLA
jgi:Pyruvate/2-oxoacid:ferredoxin oxidoreductase delta subunit